MLQLRDLTTLDDFHRVVELEREIWGNGDLVPVAILAVTVPRGAVLVGAFDGPALVGFVYSLPALKRGQLLQWSHMLGVHPRHRSAGLGRRLKMAQRERTLALGLDLIEWTFDPLQALNAHLNIVRLGAIVEEYEENVYGESTSPLHGGLPTDRLVAQWWIRRPHVERRLVPSGLPVRSHEAEHAPHVTVTRAGAGGLECVSYDLGRDDARLQVEIPTDYTGMLATAPALALQWRTQAREIFQAYFARGYRVVDFALDRDHGRGRYLLTRLA